MGFLTSRPLIEGDEQAPATITIFDIPDFERDRTLLFGYTCERESFHVFLKGGKIYRAIYGTKHSDCVIEQHDEWQAEDLAPNKRIYPESTDAEFYELLKTCEVHMSFVKFDAKYAEIRAAKFGGFHGRHEFNQFY